MAERNSPTKMLFIFAMLIIIMPIKKQLMNYLKIKFHLIHFRVCGKVDHGQMLCQRFLQKKIKNIILLK
jgi:hypothetical protein